jgi:hypothetical protein
MHADLCCNSRSVNAAERSAASCKKINWLTENNQPSQKRGAMFRCWKDTVGVESVSWQEAAEIAIWMVATGENGVNAMQTASIQKSLNAIKHAPRIYFAPVLGVFNGIKAELKRLNSHP